MTLPPPYFQPDAPITQKPSISEEIPPPPYILYVPQRPHRSIWDRLRGRVPREQREVALEREKLAAYRYREAQVSLSCYSKRNHVTLLMNEPFLALRGPTDRRAKTCPR